MKFGRLAGLGVLAVAMAGCGGGGGGGSHVPSGGGSESVIGPFTTRSTTAGPLQTVTAGSGGPVFTGIAGGSFSSIILNPQLDLNDTSILYDRAGGVYALNYSTGQSRPISTTPTYLGNTSRPTWSPDRLRIAYSQYDGSYFQIYVSNADGSNPTSISSESASETEPSWSPTSSKIAFARYDPSLGYYQIYVRNSDGSGIARLSNRTGDDHWPTWSPDGSQIAFSHFDSAASRNDIYVMNASGSNPHSLGIPIPSGFLEPAWSPDGKSIAFEAHSDIFVTNIAKPNNYREVAYSSDTEEAPSWSPDGKLIAYDRLNQIWVSDVNGNNAHQVSFDGAGNGDDSPCWSPPPAKKTLVGSGGSLGTAAAGFIFGLSGDKVTSVLAFNSGTPDSVTVTTNENPNPGDDNIVFNVSGSLNSIKFYNLDTAAVTVLPSGSTTSATGAIVAFNATTGLVATVIPFTSSRGEKPARQEPGFYTGDFLGVFDGTGTNLAASGAHTVRLEPGTGRVLSIK